MFWALRSGLWKDAKSGLISRGRRGGSLVPVQIGGVRAASRRHETWLGASKAPKSSMSRRQGGAGGCAWLGNPRSALALPSVETAQDDHSLGGRKTLFCLSSPGGGVGSRGSSSSSGSGTVGSVRTYLCTLLLPLNCPAKQRNDVCSRQRQSGSGSGKEARSEGGEGKGGGEEDGIPSPISRPGSLAASQTRSLAVSQSQCTTFGYL